MPHNTATSTELLGEKSVADILTVSIWTLRSWRRKGKGPRWMRLGGKRIVYDVTHLAIYLRNLPGGGGAEPSAAPEGS
jgi:hypothetical protein